MILSVQALAPQRWALYSASSLWKYGLKHLASFADHKNPFLVTMKPETHLIQTLQRFDGKTDQCGATDDHFEEDR